MSESPFDTMDRLTNMAAESKPSGRVYGSKPKMPLQRAVSHDFTSIAAQPRKSNPAKAFSWNSSSQLCLLG
jgi:hypothetical protein